MHRCTLRHVHTHSYTHAEPYTHQLRSRVNPGEQGWRGGPPCVVTQQGPAGLPGDVATCNNNKLDQLRALHLLLSPEEGPHAGSQPAKTVESKGDNAGGTHWDRGHKQLAAVRWWPDGGQENSPHSLPGDSRSGTNPHHRAALRMKWHHGDMGDTGEASDPAAFWKQPGKTTTHSQTIFCFAHFFAV